MKRARTNGRVSARDAKTTLHTTAAATMMERYVQIAAAIHRSMSSFVFPTTIPRTSPECAAKCSAGDNGIECGGDDADGRVSSSRLEHVLVSHLVATAADGVAVVPSKIRDFCDVRIGDIPVNVKITWAASADNAFSKLALATSLLGTTNHASVQKNRSVGEFLASLVESASDWLSHRNLFSEYHYLAVQKAPPGEPVRFMFIPMLDVQAFVSNPSNRLQIRWRSEFESDRAAPGWLPSPDADPKAHGVRILSVIQSAASQQTRDISRFVGLDLHHPTLHCFGTTTNTALMPHHPSSPPSVVPKRRGGGGGPSAAAESKAAKKRQGQYFTESASLRSTAMSLATCFGTRELGLVLEPGAGAGHLVVDALSTGANKVIAVEIDPSIPPIPGATAPGRVEWIHCDYTTTTTLSPPGSSGGVQANTVISNPPYVRRAGKPNLYLDFIELACVRDLACGGIGVFIVPSDVFFRTRNPANMFKALSRCGVFRAIAFPRDERLFAGASVDVCVFAFEKTTVGPPPPPPQDSVMVISADGTRETRAFRISESGGVYLAATAAAESPRRRRHQRDDDAASSSSTTPATTTFEVAAEFDILVGIVSGRATVLAPSSCDAKQSACCNAEIVTGIADDSASLQTTEIIRYTDWASVPRNAQEYLESHREELESRRIFKVTDKNWFSWFERNTARVAEAVGRRCVYILTVSRNKTTIAVSSAVRPFGGSVVCAIAKTQDQLRARRYCDSLAAFLNSPEFMQSRRASGRFALGSAQSLASIRVPVPPPLL